MDFQRQTRHQRNPALESLLAELNGLLQSGQADVNGRYSAPKYPSTFIVGAPRSGTTLMTQWLASTTKFAYPTNLLSRFYGAPYVGSLIQLLLTDPKYNFNNEFFDLKYEGTFSSSLGKTRGTLAPNEFWYFWRRFFPNSEIECIDESKVTQETLQRFLAELGSIEGAFDKPLVMKAVNMNFNMPFFSRVVRNAIFFHVKRQPLYNMQSLLEARINYFGDIRAWYSAKPPEYSQLKDCDPFEQVAGQVFYTNSAIESGLRQIDSTRKISVEYEKFCQSPAVSYQALLDALRGRGLEVTWEYDGPASFPSTNQIRSEGKSWEQLIAAYEKISGTRLEP